MRHLITHTFSKRTEKEVNSIRRVTAIKTYINDSTNEVLHFTDIEVIKFNRNKKIELFFETYSNKKKYTLMEYVIPHSVSKTLEQFLFSLKKTLKSQRIPLLGYIWLVDLGDMGNIHFHLTIAIKRINGKKLPDYLKRTLNNKKIYGNRVKNNKGIENYYLDKALVELGLRKRTFGRSRRCIEIKDTIETTNSKNV